MGLGIPPLIIKIMLESNPLKSRFIVQRLAVVGGKFHLKLNLVKSYQTTSTGA